ncbi:hypothetical protein [Nocardioides sp. TF02-7]|uniref:hypothetical protein n=1 Tax=Nocardioides sp. TF02-7 TaxID=2917724 RepID=UPI001F0515B5|nr:hypothetical protein [Nocardioides sp. TF02-7]UMG91346.1 hypothetical protein MF408_14395 [Nocardioides sp. TF02-7]
MDTDSATPTLGLLHYIRVLRRRWYTLVLGALGGALAAVAFLAVTPSTSTAFTSVDLAVVSSQPFALARPEPDLLNRTTEEQTARSPAVIALVADEIDRSIADIRASLEVVVLPDSTVLQLRYTAGSRDAAVRGADALAEAFLEVRSAANADRVDRILAEYDDRLDTLGSRLAAASRAVSQASGPQVAAAQAEQAVVQAEIDILLQERSRLTGIDTTGGEMIASAEVNRVETAPNRPLVLATGLLGGLLLGLLGAFAVDGIDRRVRDRHDIDDSEVGPVLAILRGKQSATPSAAVDVDAVRSVREHLLAATPPGTAVVSVADVSTQEEPTDVAVNLAVELAAADVPTELVLAEYPERTVDEIRSALVLRRRDAVADGVTTYESKARPGFRVHVPDPTADAANPATMFVSRVRELAESGAVAPMTIVALPPRASRSLVLAAGRLGTSVITVCTAGSTRKRDLADVADELVSVNATLQGTVLLRHRRPWGAGRGRGADRGEESAAAATEGADGKAHRGKRPKREVAR